jgi:hypothetical protein
MVLLLLACAEAPVETCNGLDDDGDGRVDERVVSAELEPWLVDNNGVPGHLVYGGVAILRSPGVSWQTRTRGDWEQTRTWDSDGRQLSLESHEDGQITWRETMTYGPNGPEHGTWWSPRPIADLNVEWRWAYDDYGREVLKEARHGAGRIRRTVTSYTGLSKRVDHYDSDDQHGGTWSWEYDPLNRLVWARLETKDGCLLETNETWSETLHTVERREPCDAAPVTELEEHFEDVLLVRVVHRYPSGSETQATIEWERGQPLAWIPDGDWDATRRFEWDGDQLVLHETETTTTTLEWDGEHLVSVHDDAGEIMGVDYGVVTARMQVWQPDEYGLPDPDTIGGIQVTEPSGLAWRSVSMPDLVQETWWDRSGRVLGRHETLSGVPTLRET